jgi:hypothetical protein
LTLSGSPPVTLTEADYQALLLSGTRYIDPDGLSRQKRCH